MADYKTVNLEQGMPLCRDAIRRLTYELHASRAAGVRVLKLIHGYGSSGTGGRLRVEVRRYLADLKRSKKIRGYIEGERFEIFDADARDALGRHPFLSKDPDLGRHNNGVTLVLL